MFRESTDYLTRTRQAADRLRTRGPQFARRTQAPEIKAPSAATVAAALVLVAGFGYYFGPDLVRYLKIRRM